MLASLNDPTLIERIKLLKEQPETQTDWWEGISQAERDVIDQGVEDARNGKITAHEEVRKRYEKWL